MITMQLAVQLTTAINGQRRHPPDTQLAGKAAKRPHCEASQAPLTSGSQSQVAVFEKLP